MPHDDGRDEYDDAENGGNGEELTIRQMQERIQHILAELERLHRGRDAYIRECRDKKRMNGDVAGWLQQANQQIAAQEKELQKLFDAKYDASSQQNKRLIAALNQAKKQLGVLRAEVEKLSAPPNAYGTFFSANEDGTVDIYTGGRKLRVNVHPSLSIAGLQKGQELVLNEAFNVVLARRFDGQGAVVTLKSRMDDGRVQIEVRQDEEQVVDIADSLKDVVLKEGDHLLFAAHSGLVLEKLPKAEENNLLLEEISSEITYERIGGMQKQIEVIKDAIELPYLYVEHFLEHKLKPPKGVLLYGPPGCGKTLLGKAIAAELAARAAAITGREVRAYFFNIKGPELLNKYVGETERKIREIFARARELAKEGHLVVIFWDEIESILRTRGAGISSDIESTIVPQFLSEIDGVEELRNVVIIGASNRQDLIDPAVLRPGRFDVKIPIERPNESAGADILLKYIVAGLPLDPDFALRGKAYETPNRLKTMFSEQWKKVDESLAPLFAQYPIREAIGKRPDVMNQRDLEWERWDLSTVDNFRLYYAVRIVEDVYIETNGKCEWKDRQGRIIPFNDTRLLEATLRDGTKEILYVKDFVSGAFLENIVNRAKKFAIKDLIGGARKGITTNHCHRAVQEETAQMEDLPNTSDPNTWGKIQGRFKDPIVNLRTIRSQAVVTSRKVVNASVRPSIL